MFIGRREGANGKTKNQKVRMIKGETPGEEGKGWVQGQKKEGSALAEESPLHRKLEQKGRKRE